MCAVLMPEMWSSAGQARFPQTPPQGDHSGWLVRRALTNDADRLRDKKRAENRARPFTHSVAFFRAEDVWFYAINSPASEAGTASGQ